jgi:5-methyltetrahydropteroyltriglutamate--homocysteine methyltransferase
LAAFHVPGDVADIRSCFVAGPYSVQIDFTEGRLSVKLDPSKKLLQEFIDLNNRVLNHFTIDERKRIGVHTCPGGDHDSTHSADVDYADLIPDLFKLDAANLYMQLASEKTPEHVLGIIKKHLKPGQRIYIGVIDVINPDVEEPEQVRDRILQAAEYIQLTIADFHLLKTTPLQAEILPFPKSSQGKWNRTRFENFELLDQVSGFVL